jgi:fibro-slime domain-containing protein
MTHLPWQIQRTALAFIASSMAISTAACRNDLTTKTGTDEGSDSWTHGDTTTQPSTNTDSDEAFDTSSRSGEDTDTLAECPREIHVTYYDFSVENNHPDFHCNKSGTGISKGLVLSTLDTNRKPIYNPTPPPVTGGSNPMITSADTFYDWFHDTSANVVSTGIIPLEETTPGSGIFKYTSTDHVIVPGEGGFTTEIHSEFTYKPGQVFSFLGDDDVWVFIDGKLVVDIGGLHQDETGSVALDSLGLTPGEVYPIDMFHAERCYPVSHFTLETSIDCFTPVLVK